MAAQSFPQTLTITSNGEDFEYTFSVSGNLTHSKANGASIDSNDKIIGTTASGQGSGGGSDSYSFSGEIESFGLSGDATATLNDEDLDPTKYPTNVISIEGRGSRTGYNVTVSGNLQKSAANAGSINPQDELTGSVASGYVNAGTDSYVFSGEVIDLDLNGNATVTLNGVDVDPDQYSGSILSIGGTGSHATYAFSVTNNLEKSTANGASINPNDDVSYSSASGAVVRGIDSYTFSGEIASFVLDGDATVVLNDTRIDSDQYPDNMLSIEGDGSYTGYSISVDGYIEKSTANGASINPNDDVLDSTASGAVSKGTDSYTFSGELGGITLHGNATVTLNGEQVDPRQYNLLWINGHGSYAEYSISVDGNIEKSTANGASINSNDDVSDSTASGSVNRGTDSYNFSGELVHFDLNGDATAYLNGKKISDSSRSPVVGIFSSLSDANFETIDRMEEWQGAPYVVQNFFVPWNPSTGHMNWLFEEVLPKIHAAGRVPLITWEPFTPGTAGDRESKSAARRTVRPTPTAADARAIVERGDYDDYLESLAAVTPDDIEVRIAEGEYDAYIHEWAGRLREWLAGPDGVLGTDDDREAYLRLGHEMNGDWYPWAPTVGGSPASSYAEMWRHVHDRFAAAGVKNVEWMWCVNAKDVGSYAAEELYPGDSYVDWLSIDGYQWGASQAWSTWRSPRTIFEEMLGRVRDIADKPVCIAETASTSKTNAGFRPGRKNTWIRNAFEYFDDEGIDLWCWFNEDKETDWAMFDGVRGTEQVMDDGERVNAYTAYREGVDSSGGTSSATTAERPMTTAAFTNER